MRSQLDCCDPDMKSHRKVFDLKTRATLPIRLDCSNWQEYTSYGIFKLKGRFNSFEREWYDMARSAFLKFSLQCRIGHMNGVVVAYHNTQQVFGLEYIPLEEMDRITFGSSGGVTAPTKGRRTRDHSGAAAAAAASTPSAASAASAETATATAAAAIEAPVSSASEKNGEEKTPDRATPRVSGAPPNDGSALADKSFTRTLRILDDVLNQITNEYQNESCIKLTFFSDKVRNCRLYRACSCGFVLIDCYVCGPRTFGFGLV